MKKTQMYGYMLGSLAETTWRRLRGQSKADSWPFRFEWIWGVLRRGYEGARDLSPQEIRVRQEQLAREPTKPVERVDDEVAGVDCEWFLAEDGMEAEDRAIVYLHGGGYFFGSTDTHADMLSRLAVRTRLPVLGVNYRLCPEHSVREARRDVVDVYRRLLEDGWREDGLVLAGDSAGGGLAVSTTVGLREAGVPLPAGLGLVSPWVDMHCETPSYEENSHIDYMTAEMVRNTVDVVLDGRPRDDAVVSPLYADLADFPPTLIHAGGAEILVDDCRRFAAKLEDAGGEVTLEVWPEMVHAFHAFAAMLPQGKRAIEELSEFLGRSAKGQ